MRTHEEIIAKLEEMKGKSPYDLNSPLKQVRLSNSFAELGRLGAYDLIITSLKIEWGIPLTED